MNTNIGDIAGEIWQSLDQNREKPISLTTLAKNIGRRKEDVAFGVGWLSKEGKLNIEEKGTSVKVSLL